MILMTPTEPCPCGKKLSYHECCGPLHQGQAQAETAEQLMRSRYAAFCQGEVDYLLTTLHPSKRSESDQFSLQNTVENCQWLKLELLEIAAGSADDSAGFVEFVAYFKDKEIRALRERSRFLKENGVWFYVDGESKKPSPPGRNEPCWCGSGKKSKKCHGVII